MINENVSYESRVNFKEVKESDMQKEICNLSSKKLEIFGNVTAKVLKESLNSCNAVLRYIWNFEILEKQHFHQNLKLADVTPVL